MCTMTWWRDASAYGVFFNRDERKSRSIAQPPTLQRLRGATFLAPRDPDGGGTWLMCNAYGLTVAILNAYQADWQRLAAAETGGELLSRGEIPLLLADAKNVAEATARIEELEVTRYRPFVVVCVGPRDEFCARSDETGQFHQHALPVPQPLLSSSFDPENVFDARSGAYHRMVGANVTRDRLEAFHRLDRVSPEARQPMPTAYTPKMLRADAQSFSLTELQVSPDCVRCRYEAFAPEFEGDSSTFEMELLRAE